MIFHNIYTLTIGEFAIMLKTDNKSMVKRTSIWIPSKMVEKAYNRLLIAHNENSNKAKINDLLEEDFEKMNVNADLMQYDILQQLIGIYYKTWGDVKILAKEAIDSIYKEKYGRLPEEKDFINIIKDKKLLIERAEQTFKKPNSEPKEYDFDKDLILIQKHFPNIRNEKLYLLPLFIDQITSKNE